MPSTQLSKVEGFGFQDPGAVVKHSLAFFIESFLSTALLGWEGLAFSAALGGSTELAQYFIPTRVYDFWDLIANTFGSLIGAYAYMALKKLRE